MSPWLRNEHCIVLYPDHVVLISIRREFSRAGLARKTTATEIKSGFLPGEPPWAGSLQAMESAVPGLSGKNSRATVILSNQYLRYLLLPKSDALSSEAEELAFARHEFREVYGDETDLWELRLAHDYPGKFMIASAVEQGLLAAIRKAFQAPGISLESIQPHLMAAMNGSRRDFFGKNGWLALVENGNLCLSYLENGRCSWLRSQRIGSDWRDELPQLLEREAIFAGMEEASRQIVLWAPEHEDDGAKASGPWQIKFSNRAGRLSARKRPPK